MSRLAWPSGLAPCGTYALQCIERESYEAKMFQTIVLTFPLIGVLLALALGPLFIPVFWRKYALHTLMSFAFISVLLDFIYIEKAHSIIIHSLAHEYIPFIIMLFTLYTLSTGIHIKIKARPTTFANAIFLFIGSLFSSIIGTTGAAMLLIYPFLDFNKEREYKTHLVIFFIILIANIGGLLTPLGDPPLLLGYLNGIEFSWVMTNMVKYWGGYLLCCLAIFIIFDRYILSKSVDLKRASEVKIEIKGIINILLLLLTVAILFCDIPALNVYGFDIQSIYVKDIILLILSGISLRMREKNPDFTPFMEVVTTFFVIFIVISPVLYLMEHHINDIHQYLIRISGDSQHLPRFFFALCSLTSAFLDNAPSYMLFFKMAGYPPAEFMTTGSAILTAISLSSVVMGSLTYIGNAPNLMIMNIAKKEKIYMPSFLTYCICASLIVVPISILLFKIF